MSSVIGRIISGGKARMEANRSLIEEYRRQRLGAVGNTVGGHVSTGRHPEDIVTGTPPKFKQKDRERWAVMRDEAEIARLFR